MTNKENIRVLQAIKEHPSMGVYLPDEYEALNHAIKVLKERIWTPTSEILPEEYGSYLVMWRYKSGDYADRLFYEITEYYPPEEDEEEGEWERIEQAGEAGAEIVAWMPLPERYEPKEKENG